ncbi:cardiolipin synthase [Lacticaseibacillus zhaodongensis]|uniref:cardiolipin synthase n=1 Tax=Lacticaseibacillus zhaodongensis TaxID=2668065 RepID=UPI0012D32ED2|nr:cardiolipin synthase [Lacticaseibacillus zhaodongensis]
MLGIIIGTILLLNTVTAFVTVFRRPQDIATSWAWLLVMLIPIIGPLVYFVLGRRLPHDRLRADSPRNAHGTALALERQLAGLETGKAAKLKATLIRVGGALLSSGNQVELIGERTEFNRRLCTDLSAARKTILLEAYTIEPGADGRRVRDLLTAAAKRGVTVRVLYDDFGSRRLGAKFWRDLKHADGQVETFGSSKRGRLNPRVNYRNHRKIIVIDAAIAYTGGFNIGRQKNKVRQTRDIQLRVRGTAVSIYERIAIADWNTTASTPAVEYTEPAVPVPPRPGATLQVLASIPSLGTAQLDIAYLRLIAIAEKEIVIQTPYFIPSDSLMDALGLAVGRGVTVRVLMPKRSDQPILTAASMFYMERLVNLGVHALIYQGDFVRSKVVIVDGKVASVGTANFDPRSFNLNFEVNTFIYDVDLCQRLLAASQREARYAHELTAMGIAAIPRRRKFGQELARLFAPVL